VVEQHVPSGLDELEHLADGGDRVIGMVEAVRGAREVERVVRQQLASRSASPLIVLTGGVIPASSSNSL
jgi:hypothetical protein